MDLLNDFLHPNSLLNRNLKRQLRCDAELVCVLAIMTDPNHLIVIEWVVIPAYSSIDHFSGLLIGYNIKLSVWWFRSFLISRCLTCPCIRLAFSFGRPAPALRNRHDGCIKLVDLASLLELVHLRFITFLSDFALRVLGSNALVNGNQLRPNVVLNECLFSLLQSFLSLLKLFVSDAFVLEDLGWAFLERGFRTLLRVIIYRFHVKCFHFYDLWNLGCSSSSLLFNW